MRKRKLYLSELLNRNINNEIYVRIIFKHGNVYCLLNTTSIYRLKVNGYLDKQVKSWLIKRSEHQTTLIITIDVD